MEANIVPVSIRGFVKDPTFLLSRYLLNRAAMVYGDKGGDVTAAGTPVFCDAKPQPEKKPARQQRNKISRRAFKEEARGATPHRALRLKQPAAGKNPVWGIDDAMAQKQNNLIVVLDVGSAQTRVVAAEINESSLRYRGHGVVESQGMRKGLIAELSPGPRRCAPRTSRLSALRASTSMSAWWGLADRIFAASTPTAASNWATACARSPAKMCAPPWSVRAPWSDLPTARSFTCCRAIQLALGIIPLLIVAGTIEGFVSPSDLAVRWKYLLAAALFGLLLLFVMRKTPAEPHTTAPVQASPIG